MNYELLTTENAPVKMWTKGVPVEADARQQLINTAKMPFIFKHIAVMPVIRSRGPGWIAGCNMRGLTMMFPNKTMARIITTRRGLSPRWKPVISG